MDQFTYAGAPPTGVANNNIADSIFTQMAHERHRYRAGLWWACRHRWHQRNDRPLRALSPARNAGVRVRPGRSVFGDYWRTGDATLTSAGSRIGALAARAWRRVSSVSSWMN